MSYSFRKDFVKNFLPFIVVYVAFGWWCEFKLSSAQEVHAQKVFFVVGLAFELVGALALSHFVLRNEKLQKIFADKLQAHFCGLLTFACLGALIRSLLYGGGATSSVTVQIVTTVTSLFIMGVFPLTSFFGVLDESQKHLNWSVADRSNNYALFFLVWGITLQLGAAAFDVVA